MSSHKPTTRRTFLQGGIGLVGAGIAVPALGRGTGRPAERKNSAPRRNRGVERILVLVHLSGGNDGLNTVVPWRDDRYYRHRPTLAIPRREALRLDDEYGLHPAARGLKSLYDEGMLAIVEGVGYPDMSRSHFQSADIWATASPDGHYRDGWIARHLAFSAPNRTARPTEDAVALTPDAPLALSSRHSRPIILPDAGASFERGNGNGLSYPDSHLGNCLGRIAQMVAGETRMSVYYTAMDGFDTHACQSDRHAQSLRHLGDALACFADDLRVSGHLDRVLTIVSSEFGREIAENAAGGTDHGGAGPVFLMGSRVQPGLHGEQQGVDLHEAARKSACDFRLVYSSILRNWLGTDPQSILGEDFAGLDVIRG